MRNKAFLRLLEGGLAEMEAVLPGVQSTEEGDGGGAAVLAEVAERMRDNYPYYSPLYAGQMLKPPHPVARAAYAMAMGINPNNHALDGGRASSRMELEAVAALARMFGLREHLGHLTSGGTFANLEALWVAGQMAPGTAVLASDQAHYTHGRVSAVLKLPFETVLTDDRGRMDLAVLEARLKQGMEEHRRRVGTVVVTLGTTATGSVDPLDGVLALREKYGFRVHVDAAYGGYFTLSSALRREARSAYDRVAEADSIVIDPHKHGLQPYGCGCVLFRDPAVGRFYKHDSPYTYFSSAELHLGEISLECSRAGAAAVALWATQRVLPMESGGEFSRLLDQCRGAALGMHGRLREDEMWAPAFEPELDIVCWAVRAEDIEESSRRAEQVFEAAAERGLHLAVASLPARFFPEGTWSESVAGRSVRCLRSVLMKPEHEGAMPQIWDLLQDAGRGVQQGAILLAGDSFHD